MLKKIIALLMPYHCILCGSSSTREQDLCQPCYNDLPRIKKACSKCAITLPCAYSNSQCELCIQEPPPYHQVYTAFIYEAPITRLILELKFLYALRNARVLGELLAEKVPEWYPDGVLPEAIIPIPLHVSRLRERGFNQAIELVRPIAKQFNIPIAHQLCKRIKKTTAQATLQALNRRNNVLDAFSIPLLPFKHIAIMDDVITTGSTMTEFCKTINQNQSIRLDAWSLARPKML